MPPTRSSDNASKAVLDCPHCDASFRRREHFSRHLDRHAGNRAYPCPVCPKRFARRDTLKRHVSTHGAAALQQLANDAEPSGRYACRACAQAKRRCDGPPDGTPCEACQAKGRECVYNNQASLELPLSGRSPTPHAQGGFVVAGSASAHAPPSRDDPETVPEVLPLTSVFNSQPSTYSPTSTTHVPDQPLETVAHTTDHLPVPGFQTALMSPWDSLSFEPNDFSFSLFASPNNDWLSNETWYSEDATATTSHRVPELCLADEEDELISEHVQHVASVPSETHTRILQFIEQNSPAGEAARWAADSPSLRHLDVYLQLYFEHFHPRMPFLHVPTFEVGRSAWHIVLAAAAIGCQYSAAGQRSIHLALFHRLARCILESDIRKLIHADTLSLAQLLLILHSFKLVSGNREDMTILQLHRNTLILLCRKLLSADGSLFRDQQSIQLSKDPWTVWARGEAVRRLLYFTWFTECFQSLFVMLPPLLFLTELQVSLPCSEALWRADRQQWLGLKTTDADMVQGPASQISICSLFAQFTVDPNIANGCTESARVALLLATFSQQTSVKDFVRTIVTPQQPSPYAAMAVYLDGCLVNVSQTLLACAPSHAQDPYSLASQSVVLTRLIAILAFTPTWLLHPFSRWQTTPHGSDSARKHLRLIMNQDSARTRECALHAAKLFEHFRGQPDLIHIDPFCLLIATLFLWALIDLVIVRDVGASTSSKGPQSKIVRIDQVLGRDEKDTWIKQGSGMRPHITGVGILNSGRGSMRLLKETAKIMGSGARKSTLAASLSSILSSSAEGNFPNWETSE